MRRKVLVLAGVVLVMLTLWLTARGHHIHWERFDQIEVGMTERQVEALLGGPAGDYSKGARPIRRHVQEPEWLACDKRQTWLGDEDAIDVGFEMRGTVVCTAHMPVLHWHEILIHKLCRWLGF